MKPYYEDSAVQIFHGDCREIMPSIPRCADVVMTDPPFNVPIKYEGTGGDWPRSWGDLAVMEPFFSEVFSALKGTITDVAQTYICCDEKSYPIFLKLVYPLWSQSHLLVWYKPSGRRGGGWKHSFELVLHCRTSLTAYSDVFRQDVIGIMPVRTLNRQHPAEKPGELWGFLSEAMPSEEFRVLDPFSGSGSVLEWAKRNGHTAIGIEIEERYCEIAARRMEQEVLSLNGHKQFRWGTSAKLEQTSGNGDKATREPDLYSAAET
jgi:site-specific DNA-methyltransferase (adenine-specific)